MKSSGKTLLRSAGLLCLLATGFASNAQAAPCVPTGPYGECTLQGILDEYFSPGPAPQVSNALADGADANWNIYTSVAAASIVLEIAGYASQNTFGIYDALKPGKTLQVFDGAAAATVGNIRTLLVAANPGGGFDFTANGVTVNFDTPTFGFYLTTPEASGQTYYSRTSLNGDGFDHLQAIRGKGEQFVSGPLAGQYLTAFDYLLAWEDLKGGGDKDYQDMGLVVRGVSAVPLPAAAWLLISGLAGVGLLGRRRKRVDSIAA